MIVLGLAGTWMTPLWLLSVGAAVFLLGLGTIYGFLKLLKPRVALELEEGVREGMLLPIFYLLALMTIFALTGLLTKVPVRSLLGAVSRLPSVGEHRVDLVLPAASHDFSWPLDFRNSELQGFRIETDRPIVVNTYLTKGILTLGIYKVAENHPVQWQRAVMSEKPLTQEVNDWKFDNVNAEPAHVRMTITTDIDYPQVRVIPEIVAALAGLFGLYFLLRRFAPRVSAIAVTTAKETISQPLFWIALSMGVVLLCAFTIIPYNTFGEDVKLMKMGGLTIIMVSAILVAIWSASISISDEIEGRTALTLLSKPVRRSQFILGKFLGVLKAPALLFILLGFAFMVCVSYKVVYDAREVAKAEPNWQDCYAEMIGVAPGLVLAFMETVVLAAISVAISTRLPMLPNLLMCALIYALGNLGPLLVQSSVDKFEIVHFIGAFLAMVLPVLDHFNMQAAIAAGANPPIAYLGWAALYCAVYSTIAMLLALMMFEDRDLA